MAIFSTLGAGAVLDMALGQAQLAVVVPQSRPLPGVQTDMPTILTWQPRMKMGVLNLSQQLFEVGMGMVKKPCWGNMSLRWARQEPWPVFGKGTANTEQPFIELAERVGRVPLLVLPHEDAS